jgi:hypothetical protein
MTLLLGELEKMMMSRKKNECSLINVVDAAKAHIALARL